MTAIYTYRHHRPGGNRSFDTGQERPNDLSLQSTPTEWAAQCDVQAVSRIRTHRGTTINYEDDVDWGCAPGSASLTQNVYTWRHSGAYKDHEHRANVDDVCGGWREMTGASGTAFAHFHGYACYET